MKFLLATALAAILSMAAAPGFAQDKKAEPPKDVPAAATTKDDTNKKSDAKATDASKDTKDTKDTKDSKKKVRKGGC